MYTYETTLHFYEFGTFQLRQYRNDIVDNIMKV